MAPPLQALAIQKLLSTNAHVGQRVVAHHLKQFTFGSRNGVSIYDSDKTLICLRSAAEFISAVARRNGRVMVVNTNPQLDEIVDQMTRKLGCYSPSLRHLWRAGGSLTNSLSPKKFRSRNKRLCFAPPTPPDCVVVLGSDRKSALVHEASRLRIPIVSLVDSAMPLEFFEKITYPVPANDSIEFVYLFCNLITKTFLLSQSQTQSQSQSQQKRESLSLSSSVEE